MRFRTSRRTGSAVAILTAGALSLSACSGLGGSDDSSSGNEITFLTNNDPNNVVIAEAVIKAFEEANPDIDVKLDTRPGGAEGDNMVKTRLSTGDMADVFEYNSGSLFQAIAPTTNLTPVTDEPWVADLDDTFKEVVTAGDDVYGSPWQTITGGGIFYNIPLYEKLGLEVPTTWDEFMANNEKIKAAGRRPGRADLRGHLDVADLRARRLPQRRGCEPGLGRGRTRTTRRSSPRLPRRRKVSSTCRTSRKRAT